MSRRLEAHYHDEQIYTSASWNFASVAFLFATGASRAVVQGRSRGGPENDIGHIVFAVASSAKVRHGALGALFGVDAGGLSGGSLDLPPKMRQPVKRQNSWNGENESWDCLAGGLLGSSSSPRSSGWNRAFQSRK